MTNLKMLLLAALILTAVALQGTEAGPYGANVEDSICCKDYARYPLPLRVMKDFYWTSDSCRKPGVVLITIKNREICVDPRMLWVKKILKKLSE
ncbi:PREDICTED: c-C motif chemokine 22 [Chrysochloris asiatica]|uniref:C-C motif chemokine 22 n=1 Tax=Chrysochloris asiatica TaxID=185453 RepID=A0A9B0TLH2_CHRAS|nr:PREDICTED: c-C motif chemokine 22 [Chrysochloris asiatica]